MISVVIPCLNGEPFLERQLDALSAQEADVPFEIIVADNGSTDGTVELVSRYAERDPRVSLVDASERRGVSAARNIGIRAASSDLVLLCDADDLVTVGWIAAYAEAFRSGARLVGGPLDFVHANGLVRHRQRALRTVRLGADTYPWAMGANCGFHRDVFDAVGGFDETLVGGADDVAFSLEAGVRGERTAYVEDALVVYYLRGGFRDALRQGIGYGRGDVQLYLAWRGRGMPGARPAKVAKDVAVVGRDLLVGGPDPLVGRFIGIKVGQLLGSLENRVLRL